MRKFLTPLLIVSIFFIFICCISINRLFKQRLPEPSINQWYLLDNNDETVDIEWANMWSKYLEIPNSEKQTVKVAIIDSGIDANNTEIKDCIFNFENDVNDTIGHGTAIAGIICASQYCGEVIGIADIKYIDLLPIKVVDSIESPSCDTDKLIEAILLAESHGCKICNISLNTDKDDPELERVIFDSKMLFVVSAGNGNRIGNNIDDNPSYPASYCFDNVITVTNIKANGRLHSTANYGDSVDIAAPGTEIYNLGLGNTYVVRTGTSFATPIVTGLVSMMYICDDDMTAADCKDIVLNSATQERRLNNKIKKNRVVNLNNAVSITIDRKETSYEKN